MSIKQKEDNVFRHWNLYINSFLNQGMDKIGNKEDKEDHQQAKVKLHQILNGDEQWFWRSISSPLITRFLLCNARNKWIIKQTSSLSFAGFM